MPQLDESKAYEEMVESLTTKNLEIGERCGELEATIADLESSVELSEELETQQAEDIRELQVFHSIHGCAIMRHVVFCKKSSNPFLHSIVPDRCAGLDSVLEGNLLSFKRFGDGAISEYCCIRHTG